MQPLPSTAGPTGDLARGLLRLAGPAYPAPDGSANAADALALASAISAARDTNRASLAEAYPSDASALLSEWEAQLGLPGSSTLLTTTERRGRLLARWRTRFAGTPDAILSALAALNGGVLPTMRELLASEVAAFDETKVFLFTVRTAIDPANAAAVAPLDATVAVMKPAYSACQFSDRDLNAGFFCNDANSLTNNTLLL